MAEPANVGIGTKGLLLVIRAYLVTMGLTVLITLLAIIALVDTTNCGSVGRALMALAGITAMVFLASTAVVGARAWRIFAGTTDRLVVVAAYIVLMLVSYVVFTCGLMVLFNC